MSASTALAYLPLTVEQLVDLIKQLPADEKRVLNDLLSEDEELVNISEVQQQMVMERVEKYELHPELLIDEETALKMINEM